MRATVFFIVGIALFIASCTKDPDPAQVGIMNATVDGATWESVTTSAVISNTGISITGLNQNNDALVLDVLKGTTIGSYNVKGGNSSSIDAAISMSPNTGAAYASTFYATNINVGTITISEINDANKTISGSFTGSIKRFDPVEKEIAISEGTFTKIPYNVQSGSPGNSFSAKVDGLRLSATTIAGTKDETAKVILLHFSGANKNITISTLSTVGRGTYAMGGPGNDYYGTYTAGTKYYTSYSGSINITTHNIVTKRMEGTFSFFVQPDVPDGTSLTISEGNFAVTYL